MLVIGPPVWQNFAGRCKQHPLQKSEWLFLISPLRVKLLKVSLPTFFSKKVGHPCSFSANALWQAGQTVLPYSCTEPGDTWPHRTQASAGRYLRSRMASPSVMISSGVSVVISKVRRSSLGSTTRHKLSILRIIPVEIIKIPPLFSYIPQKFCIIFGIAGGL